MAAPHKDRAAVDAAVASLQETLADGDPEDAALRARCRAVLAALRDSYRADPKSFSPEAIETLKEFAELLRDD